MRLEREFHSYDLVKVLDKIPENDLAQILGLNEEKKSKWVKVAEEARNLGISHETSEHIRCSLKEFRADDGI